MVTFLIVSQIVLAIIVTIIVLFQKSSSIGLGAYSGSNESIFGAKGPTPFLSKMTFIFGFLFVVNTIALGYIYNKAQSSTVLDSVSIVPKIEMPKVIIPTVNDINTVLENNITDLNSNVVNSTVNSQTETETLQEIKKDFESMVQIKVNEQVEEMKKIEESKSLIIIDNNDTNSNNLELNTTSNIIAPMESNETTK